MRSNHRCWKKTSVAIAMSVILVLGSVLLPSSMAETGKLDQNQKNAIAMLNYITVLSQEINASKYSRLFMEEAYSALLNNTDLNSIDDKTNSQVNRLLDTIEEYRMIDVKRDRLQYIYEQNQAQAIHEAIPNPLGLLSAVQSANPVDFVASIVYMAVDSYSSYTKYTAEADLQYIKDGWVLDDEEAANLHKNRKGTYNYMWRMVDSYNLPSSLALRENTVDEFVKYRNDDNDDARIRFLTSNQSTYQLYGGYWLLLAESYYNTKAYDKVLEAVDGYLNMGTHLFIKDYDLARILPLAILSADESLDDRAYVKLVPKFVQMILDNTDNDSWALRYYAAQAYVTLYDKSNDRSYLQNAYDVALDNVTYLRGNQLSMNKAYLSPVKEEQPPKDATKEVVAQFENVNKQLKEDRKTELPPVYEPLLLNCELLYALATELDKPESERKDIDRILHPRGAKLFLTKALDVKFRFADVSETSDESIDSSYNGYYFVFPAEYATQGAKISVSIIGPDQQTKTFDDWIIEKVERKAEGDIETYRVTYTSDSAFQHHWLPDTDINIDILPIDGSVVEPYKLIYKAKGTKNNWYDYLMPWEGHKNNWYEYALVWENSVVFEQVE